MSGLTGPTDGSWSVGDIANNHPLTPDGWVPLVDRLRTDGPPWSPGDVVDGNVLNGKREWVTAPRTIVSPPVLPERPNQSGWAWWNRAPVELKVTLIVILVLASLAILGSLLPEPQ